MLGVPIEVKRKRPVGVAVLAALTVAFGVVTALVSVLADFRAMVLGAVEVPSGGERLMLDGVAGLLVGAAFAVAGVGLWALRHWAWWLALIVGAVGVVLSYPAVLGMAVWAAIAVYLLAVRRSFDMLSKRVSPYNEIRAQARSP